MDSGVKTGLMFATGTALFWGLYGPTLAKSRVVGPGGAPAPGETPFKVYIFIGLAYLLWGIIGGAIANKAYGGNFSFKPNMIGWGFAAGSLGAFGALCLTFAMFRAGVQNAGLVMPVVFGGATSVAVFTSLIIQARSGSLHIDYRQVIGFVMVVVGIVLMQAFSSHGPPSKKTTGGAESHASAESDASDDSVSAESQEA